MLGSVRWWWSVGLVACLLSACSEEESKRSRSDGDTGASDAADSGGGDVAEDTLSDTAADTSVEDTAADTAVEDTTADTGIEDTATDTAADGSGTDTTADTEADGSGGDDVTPTGDLCQNEADLAAVASNEAVLSEQLPICATRCREAADVSACATACVAERVALSSDCADCYGGFVGCVITDCATACLSGADPAACDGCVNATCRETLATCSGFALPVCGDGITADGEACDDGNTVSGDGCASDCTLEDPLTNCLAACGDSCADPALAVCASDGTYYCSRCDAACYGLSEAADTSVCAACGNGRVESGEACDDGNLVDGDGCSASCAVEDALTQCLFACGLGCPAPQDQVCASDGNRYCNSCTVACYGLSADSTGLACARCGDGIVEGSEQCDDGASVDSDGCSAGCTVETGYACTGAPSDCRSVCGDGLTVGSERCDDGNLTDGDGCSATCGPEPGYACFGAPPYISCATVCGDGVTAGSEACDDGNTSGGDGCSATCGVESGYSCGGTPSICDTVCGDGLVTGAEVCDDGTPSCSASCTCSIGYHLEGGVCTSDFLPCDVANGSGLQTWDGSSYGLCLVTSCDSGFHAGGAGCESDTRPCDISNGTGLDTWDGTAFTGCVIAACDAGFGDCNSNAADGCEVDLASDVTNCGSCGNACSAANAASLACSAASCEIVACETDFHIESASCLPDTRSCTMEPGLSAGVLTATQHWNGTAYDPCSATACQSGYSLGFTVTFPSGQIRTICQSIP